MFIKTHTKSIFSALLVVCAVTSILLVIGPHKVYADYESGNLIDNAIFLNASSMTADQIQQFLSSKGGGIANAAFLMNCDVAGQQAKSMYLSIGAPCDQTVPASKIIYYSSQVYGLNPQVVLATMQKEQSLVTAPDPTDLQYSQAMGYACPDSGSCNSSSNFFWQIDNGTWDLRFHYERASGNMNWWYSSTSWVCGTAKTYYSPSLYPNQNVNFYDDEGVQYQTIFISNAATSALYCYTPHTFNNHSNGVTAQKVPVGTLCYSGLPVIGSKGWCYTGSYNFVKSFELWFGSTKLASAHFSARWQQLGGTNGKLGSPVEGEICGLRNDGCYQKFQNGYMLWSSTSGAWENLNAIRSRWMQLGGENGQLGYPKSGESCSTTGCSQQYEGGTISWSGRTGAWETINAIDTRWNQLGAATGEMGYPIGGEHCGILNGGCYEQFQGGYIVWSSGTGAWENMHAIRSRWMQLGAEHGELGYPTDGEHCTTSGCYQQFLNGYIYWSGGTGAWEDLGAIRNHWLELGAEGGMMGYPVDGEYCGIKNGGCYQKFQGGYMLWSNGTGAWENIGAIRNLWLQLGGENGKLGYPTDGEHCTTSGCYQTYEGGTVNWNPSRGAWL